MPRVRQAMAVSAALALAFGPAASRGASPGPGADQIASVLGHTFVMEKQACGPQATSWLCQANGFVPVGPAVSVPDGHGGILTAVVGRWRWAPYAAQSVWTRTAHTELVFFWHGGAFVGTDRSETDTPVLSVRASGTQLRIAYATECALGGACGPQAVAATFGWQDGRLWRSGQLEAMGEGLPVRYLPGAVAAQVPLLPFDAELAVRVVAQGRSLALAVGSEPAARLALPAAWGAATFRVQNAAPYPVDLDIPLLGIHRELRPGEVASYTWSWARWPAPLGYPVELRRAGLIGWVEGSRAVATLVVPPRPDIPRSP